MTLKQYTAVYKGRVQGVGFRYATVDIAAQFKDLTGYVRNVPDGSVEVVAEGNEKTCMEFLEAIDRSHLKRWIFDSRHESFPINQRHYKNFNLYVE